MWTWSWKSTSKKCKGGAICEHNHIRSTCKKCKGGSVCEYRTCKSKCCGFQKTQRKIWFQKTQKKTHSPEYALRKTKEEHKIEGLLLDNNIRFNIQHKSYSCDEDIDNSSSRVDFVIEHTDTYGTFGIIFLEVDKNLYNNIYKSF